MSIEDFENALFDDDVKKASFNKIAVDSRLGTATTKKMKKRTINPVYMKMRVENDLVTIRPHSKFDKLL
jgi:hypothetical protein